MKPMSIEHQLEEERARGRGWGRAHNTTNSCRDFKPEWI